MSPYIVLTKRPIGDSYDPKQTNIWNPTSRCAVATLADAEDEADRICRSLGCADGCAFDEEGGRVGPLPEDGTVIQVVRISDDRYREIQAGAW